MLSFPYYRTPGTYQQPVYLSQALPPVSVNQVYPYPPTQQPIHTQVMAQHTISSVYPKQTTQAPLPNAVSLNQMYPPSQRPPIHVQVMPQHTVLPTYPKQTAQAPSPNAVPLNQMCSPSQRPIHVQVIPQHTVSPAYPKQTIQALSPNTVPLNQVCSPSQRPIHVQVMPQHTVLPAYPKQTIQDPQPNVEVTIETNTNTPRIETNSPDIESTLTDELHQRAQRQKQINFGYLTEGYRRYRANHPSSTTEADPAYPSTPNSANNITKRKWERCLKQWRQDLHNYDKDPYPIDYEQHPEWPVTQAKIDTAKFFNVQTIFKKMDFDNNNISSPTTQAPQSLVVNEYTFFTSKEDRQASRSFDTTPIPEPSTLTASV